MNRIKNISPIVGFWGIQDGVGRSTILSHIGEILSQSGFPVMLIDADFPNYGLSRIVTEHKPSYPFGTLLELLTHKSFLKQFDPKKYVFKKENNTFIPIDLIESKKTEKKQKLESIKEKIDTQENASPEQISENICEQGENPSNQTLQEEINSEITQKKIENSKEQSQQDDSFAPEHSGANTSNIAYLFPSYRWKSFKDSNIEAKTLQTFSHNGKEFFVSLQAAYEPSLFLIDCPILGNQYTEVIYSMVDTAIFVSSPELANRTLLHIKDLPHKEQQPKRIICENQVTDEDLQISKIKKEELTEIPDCISIRNASRKKNKEEQHYFNYLQDMLALCKIDKIDKMDKKEISYTERLYLFCILHFCIRLASTIWGNEGKEKVQNHWQIFLEKGDIL